MQFSFLPKRILPLIFLCCVHVATAQKDKPLNQNTLSNEVDTTLVVQDSLAEAPKKKNFFQKLFSKDDYPNPRKAAIFSLVLPGAGQAYNKRYWKIPIVYGGLAALIYLVNDNEKKYRLYRDNYLFRVDDDPNTVDIFPGANENAIRSNRDTFNKYRQQSYIGLVAIWLLNSLDAYVDAHLMSFDVSEDLSLHFQPKIHHAPYQNNNIGIGMSLHFKQTRQYILQSPLE